MAVFTPFRPTSPLPWKSPHAPPSSKFTDSYPFPSASSSFLSSLRPKPLFVALLSLLSLSFLFSYASPLTSLYSSAFDVHSSPFVKKGLSPTLFRELDQIDHRAVVLRPVERAFQHERRQTDEVQWQIGGLYPPRSKGSERKQAASLLLGAGGEALGGAVAAVGGGAAGVEGQERVDAIPVPEYSIDVLPRKISLTPGSPGVDEYVPDPDRMLFGIVTTSQRAKMMSNLWQHFMVPRHHDEAGEKGVQPNCLILLASTEDPADVRELEEVMREKGLPCQVRYGKYERYEVRVLSMIREMKDYADELGKTIDWFVFGDDDTFWLDMRSLRRLLSKYNPQEEWFVGASTEAQRQLEQFGTMAFGGAGMLASRPLAAKMYERFDECFDRYHNAFGGDEMISRCAAFAGGKTKQTITTMEKGMHQFDIPGDSTGVFQSGIPIVSMHHFMASGWIHLFAYGSVHTELEQITRVRDAAAFLGGDNVFSRHVFGNGKWLVVHGYSVTYFEEPLKREDLALMEHTWYEGYPLSFEDRPHIQERHDPKGKPAKQTFYIDGTEVLSPNSALFTYLQADSWDEHMPLKERVRLQVLWDGDFKHRPHRADAAALS